MNDIPSLPLVIRADERRRTERSDRVRIPDGGFAAGPIGVASTLNCTPDRRSWRVQFLDDNRRRLGPQGRYSSSTDDTNAGSRRLAPSGQRQRPLQFFHGCLAADPKKAHPRISTTSGMPNAMVAHISSLAHGTSAWDLLSL